VHDYTVIEVEHRGAQKALRLSDDEGRFHVANISSPPPRIGARLRGHRAEPGFAILLGRSLDEVFRVSFELVDCSPAEVRTALRI
jgi:hypothetical protein